ncbi:hypothetical protein EWM64_g8450 [Hericium alpestre]|uniref:Hyaluronan/mRNA-binding protein domain-containing protein n=1 Tax=Hericium alpestre TaxID=135208 RepID=A0A4Y9ZLS1_9AGAM|nr:hypothetical protein EWM64_g8450 [Hericium alpestre]
MSVATKNPFAILEDDSSRPSTPAPAAKKTDAPAATPAPASRGAPKSRGPAARGGRYYQRGGKAPREGQEAAAEEAPADGEKKKFEGEGRGRGRGRGRGGRGGDRGGRGRPFDRHSATGKTDSDKKVHQSWGGDDGTTELKAEEAAGADAQAEVANNDWAGTPTADADPWATPQALAVGGRQQLL